MIAGPNGSGKSTIAAELIRGVHGVGRFVNADTLAAGLAGFAHDLAERRAGRIALDAAAGYVAERVDFAFETTLAGRRWARLLAHLQASGYDVLLHYVWLPSVELAAARVRYRVARGGHDVPPNAIARRYASGLQNLCGLWIPQAYGWQVLDGSGLPDLTVLAAGGRDVPLRVFDVERWVRVCPGRHHDGEALAEAVRGGQDARRSGAPILRPMPARGVVEAAATAGVRRALAVHKALGVPTAAWRDEHVVTVDAHALPGLPAGAPGGANDAADPA